MSGRPKWSLVPVLVLGLLLWELGLWEGVAGGSRLRVEALGAALGRDAALLLLGALVAVGCARRATRDDRSRVRGAAVLSLSFLALMTSVTIGRSLPQRVPIPSASAPRRPDEAVSATPSVPADERRFLCAAINAEDTSSAEGEDVSWETALGRGVRDALLLQVPLFPLAWLLHGRPRRLRPAAPPRPPLPLALGLLGLACLWESDGGTPASSAPPLFLQEASCPPGARPRRYAVAAISADLLLNEYGDHLPRGFAYVLDESPPRDEPLEPLVLRANLGDCLQLEFTNRLDTEVAAPRIEGLRATVWGTRGEFIPGTAVAPGQRLTYLLPLPEEPEAEGGYLLHDATEDGEHEARGLFGALVLEPAGASYREATTGAPLKRGVGGEALIDLATGPGFRERVLIYHALGAAEGAEPRTARGTPLPVLDEMEGPFRAGAFGLSYRSEPRFERQEAFGDEAEWRPGPSSARAAPLLRSYLGEAVKLRLVHAGSAELHIPHVHGWDEHRGSRAHPPSDTPFERPRLLTPGGGFTLATARPEVFPPAAGDYLIHCHMPNHSTGGERLTWRVFAAPQEHLAPLGAPP